MAIVLSVSAASIKFLPCCCEFGGMFGGRWLEEVLTEEEVAVLIPGADEEGMEDIIEEGSEVEGGIEPGGPS